MPKSYRIRTQLGINQNIPVKIPIVLEQNFDTLEILSLAIRPDDIYIRSCADYGIVCGRIFCNNGFGIPNARVSVFVPIEDIDTQNDYIASLYPYTNFTDINDDGYRYNLLPYTQSHSGHVPTGTFPERLDVLTDKPLIQVYEKYYKFTVKTNESGDYMIFGLPLGQQTLFMQVDLSDIGEFSLTPQDLIRMGLATESTVNGSKFKSSTNYAELPQIVTVQKTVQIEPFFGELEICNYNIARVDFDLTSENNVKLEPTAVFIGSIISTDDTQKVGKNFKFLNQTQSACKVKRTAGELCTMTTGPGQIIALRQTIFNDKDGRPILEQATLDNDGKVIDENGVWVLEVPMNLDYVYTDENGVKKISNDPKLGVPTRGKYRFKVKWSQSPALSDPTKRAYFLLPNIKERGWDDPFTDPISLAFSEFDFTDSGQLPDSDLVTATLTVNEGDIFRIKTVQNVRDLTITGPNGNPYLSQVFREVGTYTLQFYREDPAAQYLFTFYNIPFNRFMLEGSYAFSLDWNDYAVPDEAINCRDTFYDISYNKVYTTTQFIDRYQGSRFAWNTVGIKRITDTSCQGDYNTFPTNDAFYRFDFIYLIISFFLNLFKFIFIALLFVIHVLAFLFVTILPATMTFLIGFFLYQCAYEIIGVAAALANVPPAVALAVNHGIKALLWLSGSVTLALIYDDIKRIAKKLRNVTLPLVLYTDDGCERCKCNSSTEIDSTYNGPSISFPQVDFDLQTSYLINSTSNALYNGIPVQSINVVSQIFTGSVDINIKRFPIQPTYYLDSANSQYVSTGEYYSTTALPPSELYNLFNTKSKYFNNVPGFGNGSEFGWNQIKVKWFPNENPGVNDFHHDNVIVLVLDKTAPDYSLGQLISFQDDTLSGDLNRNVTTGTTIFPPLLTVTYANPNSPLGGTDLIRPYIVPILSSTTSVDRITPFASDVEYFQVITGMTIGQYVTLANPSSDELSFGVRYLQRVNNTQSYLNIPYIRIMPNKATGIIDAGFTRLTNFITDYDDYKIVILQRGIDVHSPRIPQKIDLSRIFGFNTYSNNFNNSLVVEGEFKMNYPITGTIYSDRHNEILDNTSNLFKQSYTFTYNQNDYVTNGNTRLPSYYSSVDATSFNSSNGQITFAGDNILNYFDSIEIGLNMFGTNILNNITDPNGQVLTINSNSSCNENDSSYNVNTFTKIFTSPQTYYVPYGVNIDDFSFYTAQKDNRCTGVKNVLGYQGNEVIDGASFMRSNFSYNGTNGDVTIPFGIDVEEFTDGTGANQIVTQENLNGTPRFFSTQYGTGMTTSLNNGLNIVFRSDRLPTSTTIQTAKSNSFLLHQNSQFAIFTIDDEGEASQVISIDTTPQTNNESSQIFTPPSYTQVLNSLSNCSEAVPLSCYGVNSNGEPYIKPNCVQDYIDPSGKELFFLQGKGCYNIVSRPLLTIGQDVRNLVEWMTRLNLNLALCFDVTSHNFTNQYINGTLYAYPFQNQRVFDLNNNPSSLYCTDLIYLHDQTSNFYYRSSPFEIYSQTNPELGSFVGKKNNRGNATNTGNNKFLGSPTTLLDLGPKSNFIQELVYNDDYDGYIVDKVKSTSYQGINDVLNLFILSRLISTSFNQQLIPTSDSPDEGSNDPSVKALFSNTRWNNNGATLVPGYIDGDYSQMIAINSQFGITEFSSESYTSDSVFFGEINNFPVFGLLLTGDTQDRDYISPRRTNWNSSGTLVNNQQLIDCWFTNITTNSQEVPFYQWSLDYVGQTPQNIFGSQSNNYSTDDVAFFSYKYQSLDRLNPASQYFQNDQSDGAYVRGTQINFDNNGVPTEAIPQNFEQKFLVGAPFYFYFGLKKGGSAMDVFITKYINTETNV
ncbi:hypothetical protein UFOVP117_52 [uncultured Caudovirales phage]|uniref:Uncharacterized protein n=1 Tax=uncultured Caudovirales phage TaxID=2100421 RepID=A0A6J5L5L1_9CAUD|nr:hypothetical protein UFOVP117_52 [uncultured Caudovirales phage]